MASVRFSLNVKKWGNDVLKGVKRQNITNLTAYADEEIKRIGSSFEPWDRTGNLLDSICWGIYENGKLIRSGYYNKSSMATADSYLHELSKPPKKQLVDGRIAAQEFLAGYTPDTKDGIEIVFGVLVPYWAYWERDGGHYNVMMKKSVQFKVLSQHYDEINDKLSPPFHVIYTVNSPI